MRLQQLHDCVLVEVVLVRGEELVEFAFVLIARFLEFLDLHVINHFFMVFHPRNVFSGRQMRCFDFLDSRKLQLDNPSAKDLALDPVVCVKL